MPFDTPPTEFLSVAEQTALIAAAQTATFNGKRYANTPESEAALTRLVEAFSPVIEKEARRAKVLDAEDALSTVFEEFVATVRAHDLDSTVPFHKTIGTVLRRKISDTERTSDLIAIPESAHVYYERLMHDHGHDARAAYAAISAEGNGWISPDTFRAIHNARGVLDSLDPVLTAADDDGPGRAISAAVTPSHEDRILDRAEAEDLLSRVDETQEAICRLAYGFSEIPEEAREEAAVEIARSREEGVAVVKDGTLGRVLGLSRQKVQRERTKALGVMREAYEATRAAE